MYYTYETHGVSNWYEWSISYEYEYCFEVLYKYEYYLLLWALEMEDIEMSHSTPAAVSVVLFHIFMLLAPYSRAGKTLLQQ